MKKFFIVLGSIFLALIVLGVIGIAFVAVRGNALDKESKAYADAAIPAIVTTWIDKALLDRASPEFNQGTTSVQVYHMFRWWERSLGRLQKYEPAQGQSLMSVTTQSAKRYQLSKPLRPDSKREKQLLDSFSLSMVVSGR
jgi:hypothetical protein